MDVGQIASALNHKLVIEDIDESDRDNPQLCAEYVKEIYAYMRELEVGCCSQYVCIRAKLRNVTKNIVTVKNAINFQFLVTLIRSYTATFPVACTTLCFKIVQ